MQVFVVNSLLLRGAMALLNHTLFEADILKDASVCCQLSSTERGAGIVKPSSV